MHIPIRYEQPERLTMSPGWPPGRPIAWVDYRDLAEQDKLAAVEKCWMHVISKYGDKALESFADEHASPPVVELLRAGSSATIREWICANPERARLASAWRSATPPTTAQHVLVRAMDEIADMFGMKVVRLNSAWTAISLDTLQHASVWGLVPRMGERMLDGDLFGAELSIRMFADPTGGKGLGLLRGPLSEKCACGETARYAAESDDFAMRCDDCRSPTDNQRPAIVVGYEHAYMIGGYTYGQLG